MGSIILWFHHSVQLKILQLSKILWKRLVGFMAMIHIPEVLPMRQTKPFDLTPVMRMRQIKQLLAYA